jgi:hypothetical protein
MGRAKKDAKRQAALKLLAKIKTNNLNITNYSTNININNNFDNKNDSLFQKDVNSKRNNKNTQNSFNLFKHSDKPFIKDLLSTNDLICSDETSDCNHQYLDDLSKELNFEYSYYQIPVISKSGLLLLLLDCRSFSNFFLF